MPRARVKKRIVCPECGRVLKTVTVPAAAVEEEIPLPEDRADAVDTMPANGSSGAEVDLVIEEGPVCPRCAGG